MSEEKQLSEAQLRLKAISDEIEKLEKEADTIYRKSLLAPENEKVVEDWIAKLHTEDPLPRFPVPVEVYGLTSRGTRSLRADLQDWGSREDPSLRPGAQKQDVPGRLHRRHRDGSRRDPKSEGRHPGGLSCRAQSGHPGSGVGQARVRLRVVVGDPSSLKRNSSRSRTTTSRMSGT